MSLVVLPNNKVIHGGPRIKQQPIKSYQRKHHPIHLEATYDTFIKPNNPAFDPLLPFYLKGQQNRSNQKPDPNIIHRLGDDAGLPLNPIKKTHNDHNN